MNNTAACPICKKQTQLDESNQYRPFCCKRCRLIDLGQWINESYSLAESSPNENEFDIDSNQKH